MGWPPQIDLTELPVPVTMGPGCRRELGRLAAAAGGTRALVVTDAGIVSAGHVDAARTGLVDAGLAVSVYDHVHENPTTDDVTACVEAARAHDTDVLIGLGGGSSMDAAKGCNFLYTNGGRMEDYWGVDKATRPMLPFIALPTTGGTGSECQRFALISQPGSHRKMACGDSKALARVAILDPELTLTQPPFVTACTGMDAIAHAVESAVSRPATDRSRRLAIEAFRLLDGNFHRVLSHPGDLQARAAMQLGAACAGAAIEYSMLGAAHAAANPLTARADVVHGQAVGIVLPAVVRFNRQNEGAMAGYRALAEAVDGSTADAGEWLAARIEEHLERAGLRRALASFGIDASALDELAADAAGQWTAQFNPRAITAGDFVSLYKGL